MYAIHKLLYVGFVNSQFTVHCVMTMEQHICMYDETHNLMTVYCTLACYGTYYSVCP